MTRLREGTTADLDRVLALWAGAHALPGATDDAASLARLLALDPAALLLAEADGEIVGSLIAAWNGWRGSFFRLAVDADRRRRGIAAQLVREGEIRLRRRGAARVDAIVAADDRAAVAVWEVLGYERQRDRVRFVRDFGRSEPLTGPR